MDTTPPPSPPAHAGPLPSLGVRQVGALQPLRWLRLGARDLLRCPLPGLLHGLAAAAFGALLLWFARDRFWLLAGAFSGFLLVAPIVATGLYAVSRRLERGPLAAAAGLHTALAAWRPRDGRLVRFGVLLALACSGWVLTSASLITGFAQQPVQTPADFLRVVIVGGEAYLFEIWLVLGSALAAPIFASTVTAIPVLLDRRSPVLAAVLTSVRATLINPLPMALWATLILGLTLAGMALALIGLVIVVPWLAHASWHAYRDLVAPDDGQGADDPPRGS
jgi:uncharacterized membrane protein